MHCSFHRIRSCPPHHRVLPGRHHLHLLHIPLPRRSCPRMSFLCLQLEIPRSTPKHRLRWITSSRCKFSRSSPISPGLTGAQSHRSSFKTTSTSTPFLPLSSECQ